jgi:predicted RNA binding protein YcfA (HicA-like mRNA interferase family)
MPRLYSSRHIIKVLEGKGFYFVSQRGSHAKYHRIIDGKSVIVIIPVNRSEIPHGTFHSILRQSGMRGVDFRK